VRVLVDTNVLLRFLEPEDSGYSLIRSVMRAIRGRGDEICFASQSLVEFWNVCTRPADRNGLGLSIPETDRRARIVEGQFLRLTESEHVHEQWRRLVVRYSVHGVQVHDARLVAAMLAHGVPQLVTLNERDFKRYQEISAIHPRDALPAM
jgi:predicted nucleic acid-binding protein